MDKCVVFNIIKSKGKITIVLRGKQSPGNIRCQKSFIHALFKLKSSSSLNKLYKQWLPLSIAKEIIIQQTNFLTRWIKKFLQMAMTKYPVIFLVNAKTTMPETPTSQITNTILKIFFELNKKTLFIKISFFYNRLFPCFLNFTLTQSSYK